MQLPYMYLPYSDWVSFAEAMAQFNLNIQCSPLHNYCKFKLPCNNVALNQWFLEFELFDDSTSNRYALPSTNAFLISGEKLGDSVNTCYLPVFQSNYDDGTMYIGNLFMNYFYMVFDMSPYDEFGKDYITVGVAPINPDNIVGQEFYKPNGTDPIPPKPTNDSSSSDTNSTVPIPDPGNDTQPIQPVTNTTNGTTNGTDAPVNPTPVDPITPTVTPTDPSGEKKSFMQSYGLWVIIGGILVLVIVVCAVVSCMKKKEKDPYFDKKYSAISEDAPLKGSLGI
jgi:hypothetical protein